MKFCKQYREYRNGREKKGLPGVELEKLNKILKRCGTEFQLQQHQSRLQNQEGDEQDEKQLVPASAGSNCRDHCPVCDGSFFPSLLEEMSAVSCCFTERAKKLLQPHLATGFKKLLIKLVSKFRKNHGALILEGRDLLNYAIVNYNAMWKILNKYDKIHNSKKGQAFRNKTQDMHIGILQSPWLSELIAFYINMKEKKTEGSAIQELFSNCTISFENGKPNLSCGFFDSMKLDISLTCSICLDTVFDPVSLTCGHIFCYLCCCSAASVTIVDGLKSANVKEKCPLCRREGVYNGAVHMDELSILLRKSCPDYWKERLKTERKERIQLTKKYWESQCQAFMGM